MTTPGQSTALAAAIRALAAQYRDLAVAEELDLIAIRAEQYPDMPATNRMQRALWDAEEVLMERLQAIQNGVNDIRTAVSLMQVGQDGQAAIVNGLQIEVHTIGATVDQVITTFADLNNRDARQYAESAGDRADLRARLDRIEVSLAGRAELVAQHLSYEARISALEQWRDGQL